MPKHLQNDLEQLRKIVLEVGTMCEENLARALAALYTRNSALAEQVIAKDAEIDRREVLVEEECLKILALHQPVAKDLRFVVTVLKMNNDIERVGDLAGNIAQRAQQLSQADPIAFPPQLHQMAEKTKMMFKKSLDSLVYEDVNLAKQVILGDDEVDSLHSEMFKIIQQQIKENVEKMEQLIQLLSITRYLERIADQATNIAEDVLYMVDGEVVRHLKHIKH